MWGTPFPLFTSGFSSRSALAQPSPSTGIFAGAPSDVVLPTGFKLCRLPGAREWVPEHACVPAQAATGLCCEVVLSFKSSGVCVCGGVCPAFKAL